MPTKATDEQRRRVADEAWSLTELALRAGVHRATAARWRSEDYAGMPEHTAEALIRQADGVDLPPAAAIEAIHRLAARRCHHA
jgi:hypothetical protein